MHCIRRLVDVSRAFFPVLRGIVLGFYSWGALIVTEFVEMPLLPASDASHGGRFSYAVAEAVKSVFESAASRVEGQSGSRSSYGGRGEEDFQGHFSEVFAANAVTAPGTRRPWSQRCGRSPGMSGR